MERLYAEMDRARRVLFGRERARKRSFLDFSVIKYHVAFTVAGHTYMVSRKTGVVYLKMALEPGDKLYDRYHHIDVLWGEWVDIGILNPTSFRPRMPNFMALVQLELFPESLTFPATVVENAAFSLPTQVVVYLPGALGNMQLDLRWVQFGARTLPSMYKGTMPPQTTDIRLEFPVHHMQPYLSEGEVDLYKTQAQVEYERKACVLNIKGETVVWRSDDVRRVCMAHAYLLQTLRNSTKLETFWRVQDRTHGANALNMRGIEEIEFWRMSPERQVLVDWLRREPSVAASRLLHAAEGGDGDEDVMRAARTWMKGACIVCNTPNAGFTPLGAPVDLRVCSLACYAHCK